MPDAPKPGIDQLLVDSALQPGLCRRLLEAPEEVFAGYDLTEEEREILRHPDQRLLPLLGAALARQAESAPAPEAPAAAPPHAVIQGQTLPDISLALTLVPCAQYENGEFKRFAYAVWVNPLAAGTDPASLPPPPGAVFPGQPLSPLRAVIQVSAVQLQDAAGQPQVGLWASLRQSSNMTAAPPREAAADPASAEVRAAVAAVRAASREERYGRLIDLMRALRGGEAS